MSTRHVASSRRRVEGPSGCDVAGRCDSPCEEEKTRHGRVHRVQGAAGDWKNYDEFSCVCGQRAQRKSSS